MSKDTAMNKGYTCSRLGATHTISKPCVSEDFSARVQQSAERAGYQAMVGRSAFRDSLIRRSKPYLPR